MIMVLLNHATQIEVIRTVGQIQGDLAAQGAKFIIHHKRNGEHIVFQFKLRGGISSNLNWLA